MAVTVFVWDMFRGGVGHASMHVSGAVGSVYVSFWPATHTIEGGLLSRAKIHFMNADRKADGVPQWASKPITDLNEAAIIRWWSQIQHNPLIDYKDKKPFQLSNDDSSNFQISEAQMYNIFANQCSTTVVAGLMAGASTMLKLRIGSWLAVSAGKGLGPIQIPSLIPLRLPTITPKDVKNLVVAIWNDF